MTQLAMGRADPSWVINGVLSNYRTSRACGRSAWISMTWAMKRWRLEVRHLSQVRPPATRLKAKHLEIQGFASDELLDMGWTEIRPLRFDLTKPLKSQVEIDS
jgi:hypothetical protein